MRYIEDVIRIARNEIGYFEKATNDRLDSKIENAGDGHYTKYARDLDMIEFYNTTQNGVNDVFVPWCFVQAFGADVAKEMCNIPDDACSYNSFAINYYGQLYNEPLIGDQMFFYGNNGNIKTAIVEIIIDGSVCVIGLSEFGICRMFFDIDDASIIGYCRPKYDKPEDVKGCMSIADVQAWLNEEFDVDIKVSGEYDDDTKLALIKAAQKIIDVKVNGSFSFNSLMHWKIVRRGDIGYAARIVQAALICNGYSCGSTGANGYFNNDSVETLKRFQANNKMVKDGLAGKAVMTKLFG